jgi:hypothetical protein
LIASQKIISFKVNAAKTEYLDTWSIKHLNELMMHIPVTALKEAVVTPSVLTLIRMAHFSAGCEEIDGDSIWKNIMRNVGSRPRKFRHASSQ